MTSAGIRYSNIEPDHEISAEPRPTGVSARPSRNQCVGGDVALGDREEARQPGLRGEQVVVARVERAVARPGSRSRRACASGRTGSRSPSRGTARWARSAIALEAPDERRGGRRAPSASPAGRVGQLGDRREAVAPAARRRSARSRSVALDGRPAASAQVDELAVRRPRRAPPVSAARDVRERAGVGRELGRGGRPTSPGVASAIGAASPRRAAARAPRRGAAG